MRNKNGKFIKSAKCVDVICLFCKKLFKTKKSGLKYGRGKYCCRKCFDEHKKETQKGKNNGMYGKTHTKDVCDKKSKVMTELWKSKNHRKKVSDGIKKFIKHHGYYPGTDEKTKEKRKNTFLEKYGVDHNWKVKEIRNKCEQTCLKIYGKHSWEILFDSFKDKETQIEKIIRTILVELSEPFEQYYKIFLPDGYYKEYDFYLLNKNILIEADGDFWHANPKYFSEIVLLDIQRENINNDKFKNLLAEDKNIPLIRFWESEIKKENFKDVFTSTINRWKK
jgi:hypothetical protein